jgi:hypothetical protein
MGQGDSHSHLPGGSAVVKGTGWYRRDPSLFKGNITAEPRTVTTADEWRACSRTSNTHSNAQPLPRAQPTQHERRASAHEHTVCVAGPGATLRRPGVRDPRIARVNIPLRSLNNRQGKSGHGNDAERQMKAWHPVEMCASVRVSSWQYRRCIEHVTGGETPGLDGQRQNGCPPNTPASRSSGSE